ncbi:MAG: hypothetical protein QGI78_00365 [Phycisphaerales bacterium]|jgi:hypothetical protein|nr:hypothetical protein [Phycisphaerales bacterium]
MQLMFNLILTLTITQAASAVVHRQTIEWSDINTREVVKWEGDTAILAQGAAMTELQCKILIDPMKVERAIDSFGIPEAWTKISYRSQEELKQLRIELRDKAEKHGIEMSPDGNRFSVDYNWVVQNSIGDLRVIANTIRSTARRKGYRTRRELVGAIASFVQELTYQLPPEFRMNDEGEKILTAGATMPLETLANERGDCDTKSLLFAGLVRSISLIDVIFVATEDHLFAGIRMNPSQHDHFIRHKGRSWILIELSDSWPIGHVPQNHLNIIKQGDYRVIDID